MFKKKKNIENFQNLNQLNSSKFSKVDANSYSNKGLSSRQINSNNSMDNDLSSTNFKYEKRTNNIVDSKSNNQIKNTLLEKFNSKENKRETVINNPLKMDEINDVLNAKENKKNSSTTAHLFQHLLVSKNFLNEVNLLNFDIDSLREDINKQEKKIDSLSNNINHTNNRIFTITDSINSQINNFINKISGESKITTVEQFDRIIRETGLPIILSKSNVLSLLSQDNMDSPDYKNINSLEEHRLKLVNRISLIDEKVKELSNLRMSIVDEVTSLTENINNKRMNFALTIDNNIHNILNKLKYLAQRELNVKLISSLKPEYLETLISLVGAPISLDDDKGIIFESLKHVDPTTINPLLEIIKLDELKNDYTSQISLSRLKTKLNIDKDYNE